MRVFVTGASGWIGSHLVPELLDNGHQVIGLARSDRSAEALAKAGAQARRGTIDDLDVLSAAAAEADGVVHLAFKHDTAFSGGFEAAAGADRKAIEAFGEALAGSGKPFVIASGLLGLKPNALATEQDGHGEVQATGGPALRHANAEYTLGLADRGVRSSVLRLPPTVHGDGDHGFMHTLVELARTNGVAGYVGDGANRWPAAHVTDAARLFRLALEQAPAGSTLHAVADEGVAIKDVAEVFARHLDLPAGPLAPEKFSWLGGFIGLDSPASSARTRELLGWTPTGPGLLADLDMGHYYG